MYRTLLSLNVQLKNIKPLRYISVRQIKRLKLVALLLDIMSLIYVIMPSHRRNFAPKTSNLLRNLLRSHHRNQNLEFSSRVLFF